MSGKLDVHEAELEHGAEGDGKGGERRGAGRPDWCWRRTSAAGGDYSLADVDTVTVTVTNDDVGELTVTATADTVAEAAGDGGVRDEADEEADGGRDR